MNRQHSAILLSISVAFASPLSVADAHAALPPPIPASRTDDGSVSPEARALLDRSAAAMTDLGACTARVVVTSEGEGQRTEVEADVHLAAEDVAPGLPFRRAMVAAFLGADGEIASRASFDGVTVLHQMPDQRSVWEIRLKPEDGFPFLPLMDVVPPGFGARDPFGWDGVGVTLGADQEVDGRAMHTLVAVREMPTTGGDGEPVVLRIDIVRLLDGETHLPRREVTRWSEVAEGKPAETMFSRIIDLPQGLVRAAAGPSDFEVETPDGWERVDATPKPQATLQIGSAAPAFTLEGFDGATHSLDDFRGRVVVLDFWATWCGPCKMAMPALQAIHEDYGADRVAVIGLAIREESADAPPAYFAEKGYGYLGLYGTDDVAAAYLVGGIPHLVVVAPDGTVAWQHVGYGDDLGDRLREVIDGLSGE